MNPTRIFFIGFSAVIALVGLAAASLAQDYLQGFGFGLFGFGVAFGFSRIKRHYDTAVPVTPAPASSFASGSAG